eukprot:gene17414-biopygen6349
MRHHVDISSFLAAQGLAFRGHDESRSSCNRGNFLELLELLACYSDDLRSFLDNDRITYTSHGPQNELIECLSEEVRGEIQRRIDASTFIAVMMDDSSDASNVEQTVVSVRLVYDGEVEEHMLDPIAVENNLEILYGNSEILTLLNKAVCKRDAVVAKKKESRRKHLTESEETALDIAVEREALDDVEEKDEFEIESKQGIDFDSVKEGYAGLQDLLSVIKDAELEEALPQVMTLLKLAAVTPLTSVHCERVFSHLRYSHKGAGITDDK